MGSRVRDVCLRLASQTAREGSYWGVTVEAHYTRENGGIATDATDNLTARDRQTPCAADERTSTGTRRSSHTRCG